MQWLNWALMADLFFVMICFVWFAIAVIGKNTGISLGLDLWYRLWTPVMQPAIGIFMAGAILSGVTSWIAKRFSQAKS